MEMNAVAGEGTSTSVVPGDVAVAAGSGPGAAAFQVVKHSDAKINAVTASKCVSGSSKRSRG